MAHTSLLYNYQRGAAMKKHARPKAPSTMPSSGRDQSSVVVPNQKLHKYATCL